MQLSSSLFGVAYDNFNYNEEPHFNKTIIFNVFYFYFLYKLEGKLSTSNKNSVESLTNELCKCETARLIFDTAVECFLRTYSCKTALFHTHRKTFLSIPNSCRCQARNLVAISLRYSDLYCFLRTNSLIAVRYNIVPPLT